MDSFGLFLRLFPWGVFWFPGYSFQAHMQVDSRSFLVRQRRNRVYGCALLNDGQVTADQHAASFTGEFFVGFISNDLNIYTLFRKKSKIQHMVIHKQLWANVLSAVRKRL